MRSKLTERWPLGENPDAYQARKPGDRQGRVDLERQSVRSSARAVMQKHSNKPFKVGDLVQPRPEWRKPRHIVPRGRVRAIERWGDERVLYVGNDPRAFAEYVFMLNP